MTAHLLILIKLQQHANRHTSLFLPRRKNVEAGLDVIEADNDMQWEARVKGSLLMRCVVSQ
eukprot:scaffold30749_cov69-Skeletonema_dohrnii-CCMP3373.AAC.1